MNTDNTLQQVIEYKNKILKIPNSESLDDIKEMESYDYDIVSLIYDYCVSKNYNIDGFPDKYSEFIANDDDDFYDFLSFKVQYYYGLKNALLHKEVLLYFKTYYYYPEAAEYTDEACKEDILLEISLLKDEGVNLDFNKEDY
ncbi:hypothetical protein [Formosa sp. A9]|uniref:hypothetical protein n=1 Tax=Formosa sp. A9 TaxID=3442641 RepID=UPI003EBA66B1